MTEFVDALRHPDVPFLRYALIVGLLSSLAFGIVGTYVVARRLVILAGAIAHCVLAGIGAALYFRSAAGLTWLHPIHGALVTALASAVIIGLVSRYAQEREDTVIGVLWAVGMAIGLLFLAKTPGYIDPMSYLWGNILLITKTDLWTILTLDALVVTVGLLFHSKFIAVCFDEEFAQLRGLHVERYYLLLLGLTALTVVSLIPVMGILMVLALLVLPTAIAAQFSRRIWHMMLAAILCCIAFTTVGLGLSYSHDLPSGPTIIVLGGVLYLAVLLARRLARS